MEVHEAIAAVTDADDTTLSKMSMNRVADIFRDGADVRALLPLITHRRPQVVECGAWIASEIVSATRGREIFAELGALLTHPNPAVRFWTIGSVAVLLTPTDLAAAQQWFSLLADSNSGVRRQALYWACWIPDAVVGATQGSPIWFATHLLMASTKTEEVRAATRSAALLEQRAAVAGVLRNFVNDAEFFAEMCAAFDKEVVGILKRLPRNRTFSLPSHSPK